jgi:hypothetical protein
MPISPFVAAVAVVVAGIAKPTLAAPPADIAASLRDAVVTQPTGMWQTGGGGAPPPDYHSSPGAAQGHLFVQHQGRPCGKEIRDSRYDGLPVNGERTYAWDIYYEAFETLNINGVQTIRCLGQYFYKTTQSTSRELNSTRPKANEIILINSLDGASSHQMLAGVFRFICHNGMVVGDVVEDIRIPHKGNIQGEVIEDAFRVLDEFVAVDEHAEAMKALPLEPREEIAFATAALALRFGERGVEQTDGHRPAPVTAEQLNEPRRIEDIGHTLWATFQRVQ